MNMCTFMWIVDFKWITCKNEIYKSVKDSRKCVYSCVLIILKREGRCRDGKRQIWDWGMKEQLSEKGRWVEEWKGESRPASSSSSSSSSWSELDEEWSPAAELTALFTPRSPYSSPEIQQPSETTHGLSTEGEDEKWAGVLRFSHPNLTRGWH